MLEWTTIIGIAAGILTTAAVIPQIYKAWKTKKVQDVSPGMFIVLLAGLLLWVVYGVMKKDVPIIATNGLALALNGFMLFLMVRYKDNE